MYIEINNVKIKSPLTNRHGTDAAYFELNNVEGIYYSLFWSVILMYFCNITSEDHYIKLPIYWGKMADIFNLVEIRLISRKNKYVWKVKC